MLKSVEAQINVDGSVEILEPIEVSVKSRAIVTVLDEAVEAEVVPNGPELIDWLDRNKHTVSGRESSEVDHSIEEIRNSWD